MLFFNSCDKTAFIEKMLLMKMALIFKRNSNNYETFKNWKISQMYCFVRFLLHNNTYIYTNTILSINVFLLLKLKKKIPFHAFPMETMLLMYDEIKFFEFESILHGTGKIKCGNFTNYLT